MSALGHAFLVLLLALSCSESGKHAVARVPPEEVDALGRAVKRMGATYWEFNAETCKVEMVGLQPDTPIDKDKNITCDTDCQLNTCHIVAIELKRLSLPGVLPHELVELPHLNHVDLAYNYLQGSIPVEWASTKIESMSLSVNRLSGEIPRELGNLTSLRYLNLEANFLNGTVPPELGKLTNLGALILSSNRLTGSLPLELAELINLTDFRINDNGFTGPMPDFIQNWKQLKRLEMIGSGLEGPIPSSISLLNNVEQLKLSDMNGTGQAFPELQNMTSITRLYLRNCNISGRIPDYIWDLESLVILDLSFNKLVGELPNVISSQNWKFLFLTGNMLGGKVPESILRQGTNVDLSYNNFTWQSPEQPACRPNIDQNLNLFRSSQTNDLRGVIPCKPDLKCSRYSHSLYVNCGGQSEKMDGKLFEGEDNGGGAAVFSEIGENWGFSSTGDFMDDNNFLNKMYTIESQNGDGPYATARLTPLSLAYFHYCLLNENYTISLHFSEILFSSDQTYMSLGRRIFDIYIQDELVQKDFNIASEARGVSRPVIMRYNVSVTHNILEIRFKWAGKGTTRIPERSVYGPLISAISVDPNFKPPSEGENKRVVAIAVGVVGSSLVLLALGIILWKLHQRKKHRGEKGTQQLNPQMGTFTLKQIKAATNNFDQANKIGEGGFGPVYKGKSPDGTIIAVKQLSSKSKQGNREFLNEMGVISCLNHPNLVKLYGCCVEGDQLMLVYEYMENNSLTHVLLGKENEVKLDWATRQRICVGIAKGLYFLHEESRLKIVHRDIKGTNILLDRDLNPKISDFGLAKLDDEENTHISTRVAGTIGYMAPEYALWGYLTHKVDVYSFGIVALELASGKHHTYSGPGDRISCLLDWACHLQQSGKLTDLVDEKLGSDFNKVEADRMVRVALLCTNASPALRPSMSEIVLMLEGNADIPNVVPDASTYTEDLRFKAIRDHQQGLRNLKLNDAQSSASVSWQASTTTSAYDLYAIREESYLRSKIMGDQYDHTEESRSAVSEAPFTNIVPSLTSSSSANNL